MSLPGNGIYVVRGEMSTLMTAMRRSNNRWNASAYGDEEKDGLTKLFIDLKEILNRIEDLRLIDPNIYLTPFLEVIRTDETTGVVTGLAIASINKFLSYGLIDPTSPNLPVIVENIADAVTHARFMGTDQASDGFTLYRVVQVLHTLMRSPEGSALTNEAVCEVMLSCFKICFEQRVNELLRRYAEQALKDMVLLLFMRLPQFSEDRSEAGLMKKFQMMAASIETEKKQRKQKQNNSQMYMKSQPTNISRSNSTNKQEERKISTGTGNSGLGNENLEPQTPQTMQVQNLKVAPLATTPATPAGNILDMQGKIIQTPTTALTNTAEMTSASSTTDLCTETTETPEDQQDSQIPVIQIEANSLQESSELGPEKTELSLANANAEGSNEYINSMGVRFTQQNSIDGSEGLIPLVPYGLPCIQELFRFLIMLCNPLDKQNTDSMVIMGLNLLTIAFEVGADNIGKYDTLLELVKDDLCRHLISLFKSERVSIFAADLQLCFLMFESLRGHLKLQLEAYLKKLSEIIASDNPKTPYEVRELALDNLRQLCRIPGFVAELYINYDCDLYCSDMFESLVNLLSKYTLSATNAIYSTHILALETLLSIIDNIENNCIAAKNSATAENPNPAAHSHRHSRHNSGLEGIIIDSGNQQNNTHDEPKLIVENISKFINLNSSRYRFISSTKNPGVSFTREQLFDVKQKKRILSQGTELFNQRPDKGIHFLQENGIFNPELDPKEVAIFLRENPGLDKKMIGEYISKKKNVDSKILMNFVESFDFTGLRVDQALRLYLETFRLPGEAPLIFLVLEHFADYWHRQNGEPFDNADSAFRLAYAIIMLNMDQHNTVAKRLNIPMTPEDFLKNLRGLNGSKDFDQDMLLQIFNAIKNEEIVMPAEQTGLVRENYLWKVLLRRGLTTDGNFHYVEDASYDNDIFRILWGPSLSSLTFMFDRSTDTGYQRTLNGFMKFAGISAHYQQHEDFDAIILTLCKFSTLFNNSLQNDGTAAPQQQLNEIIQAAYFGSNPKAQAAMKTVFLLVHDYGDCLREGWKNILDIYLQLFKLKLLPKALIEVEDFCEENGKAQLILEKSNQKQEAGILSSLYSYLSSEGQKEPTYEEQEFIKIGKKCIKECQLDQMIQETKFVQVESLQELLKAILCLLKAPTANKSLGLPYSEDITVFWMEFLVKVVIHNRDRMIPLWPDVRDQMYLLLMGSSSCGYDYLMHRCIVAVLKLAIYLMRNEELCPIVLQSLKMLLILKPSILLRISKQISIGIFELLKTSAQNIHTEQDWQIIFTILECVGAGAIPPEIDDASLPIPNGCTKSEEALSSEDDSGLPDKGNYSDSEISARTQAQQQLQSSNTSSPYPASPSAENWILVNKDSELSTMSRPQSPPSSTFTSGINISSLVYECKLMEHSPFALFKCWDSLAFIVRNVAHITPYNFESCVRCIRTFVEASRDGGYRLKRKFEENMISRNQSAGSLKKKSNKRSEKENQRHGSSNDPYGSDARSDNEEEGLTQRYETLSIQLLDLMYTLYTRTAQIFRWWAEEDSVVPQCSALWAQGWCPLLQGIARLATDRRREVRTYAISCLQQRALLFHDLQTLSGSEWASCFQQVLFPLLNELLPESHSIVYLDTVLLEESRIRTATIMSKVFLHHLTPLIELSSAFNDLWLEILNYIEKFMKVGSDMLSEQMQEILKNMLLVMHSVRVFHSNDGLSYLPLWDLTWHRIGLFLPKLKDELFRDEGTRKLSTDPNSTIPSIAIQQTPSQIPQQSHSTLPVPPVSSLGQSQASTQAHSAATNEAIVSQSPLTSPFESPRHSIILQAASEIHGGQSLLLGQISLAHSMPILIPPTSPQTSPTMGIVQDNTEQQQSMTSLVQPIPQLAHAATAPVLNTEIQPPSALPDLLNGAQPKPCALEETSDKMRTKLSEDQPISSTCYSSFAIDFPDDDQQLQPEAPYTEQSSYDQDIKSNYTHFNIHDKHYEYFQQMHFQHSQENQQQMQQLHQQFQEVAIKRQLQQQQQQQNQQHLHFLHQTLTSQHGVPTAITNTVDTLSGSVPAVPEVSDVPANSLNPLLQNVNVPMSHLMAGNQYNSALNRNPNPNPNTNQNSNANPNVNPNVNPNLVQSFAPIYRHSEHQTSTGTPVEADIYQEYIQNPYNLKLEQQQDYIATDSPRMSQSQQEKSQQQQQHEQQQQGQNLFANSVANYFTTNPKDGSTIPPGSEILFGQQS